MPFDLPDVWRDEDGVPSPTERCVDWWKETHARGKSAEAIDLVLLENGIDARRKLPRVRRPIRPPSRLYAFSYLASTRADRLQAEEARRRDAIEAPARAGAFGYFASVRAARR